METGTKPCSASHVKFFIFKAKTIKILQYFLIKGNILKKSINTVMELRVMYDFTLRENVILSCLEKLSYFILLLLHHPITAHLHVNYNHSNIILFLWHFSKWVISISKSLTSYWFYGYCVNNNVISLPVRKHSGSWKQQYTAALACAVTVLVHTFLYLLLVSKGQTEGSYKQVGAFLCCASFSLYVFISLCLSPSLSVFLCFSLIKGHPHHTQ